MKYSAVPCSSLPCTEHPAQHLVRMRTPNVDRLLSALTAWLIEWRVDAGELFEVTNSVTDGPNPLRKLTTGVSDEHLSVDSSLPCAPSRRAVLRDNRPGTRRIRPVFLPNVVWRLDRRGSMPPRGARERGGFPCVTRDVVTWVPVTANSHHDSLFPILALRLPRPAS